MYLTLNNQKINIKIAQTWSEKIKGLSFKKNITTGLYIPNCNHIQTYFMKEEIDVLFLDNRNSVLYKYENMPPKRDFKVYEDIKKTNVLELPKNTSKNIHIGEILFFEREHII